MWSTLTIHYIQQYYYFNLLYAYGLSNGSRCLLALGDVEEAQKAFEMCLKSNHLSSLDRKIVKEASDGLQKTQVASRLSFGYHARLSTKCARLYVLN